MPESHQTSTGGRDGLKTAVEIAGQKGSPVNRQLTVDPHGTTIDVSPAQTEPSTVVSTETMSELDNQIAEERKKLELVRTRAEKARLEEEIRKLEDAKKNKIVIPVKGPGVKLPFKLGEAQTGEIDIPVNIDGAKEAVTKGLKIGGKAVGCALLAFLGGCSALNFTAAAFSPVANELFTLAGVVTAAIPAGVVIQKGVEQLKEHKTKVDQGTAVVKDASGKVIEKGVETAKNLIDKARDLKIPWKTVGQVALGLSLPAEIIAAGVGATMPPGTLSDMLLYGGGGLAALEGGAATIYGLTRGVRAVVNRVRSSRQRNP
jgi:hypothetical protein